jgi:hypothetical protein
LIDDVRPGVIVDANAQAHLGNVEISVYEITIFNHALLNIKGVANLALIRLTGVVETDQL